MVISKYLLLLFLKNAVCLDDTKNGFIKSYVINENKPTFLIFNDLCWTEFEKLSLSRELLPIGVRVSESVALKLKYQEHFIMFLMDLDCDNAEKVLDSAIASRLFRSPFRWLLLNSVESHRPQLEHLPALPDSDVVLAQRTDGMYSLVELHRPSLNLSLIRTPRGYFNCTLVDTRAHKELYKRRKDLMGHPLTMSNVIQESNSTKYHLPREDGLEFQYDAISKLTWMNARLGMTMLNATPRYIFSYRYGYKVNGEWSGMVDDLRSGRADLGTNCMMETVRLEVVAYTDPLAPFRARFVFRQPPLSYITNIYALPFKTNLWVGTAVCVAVSAAVTWVATHWEAKFGKSHTTLDGSVSDAVFLTISALSQQGCAMEPNKLSGRIGVWAVFTALMALHVAYSANIVALLQAPSNSIKTLPQLAAAKITLAANDVDYNHFVFKQFKDPVHVAIRQRADPEKGKPQFYDINEGVERIRKGLFAFHSIAEPVYRRIEQTFYEAEKCDLMEIDYLNSFDPYVPIQKDSPYMELIKVAFKRIRETGLQSAVNERHQARRPSCAGGGGGAFTSVGPRDIRAVLAMLAGGAVGGTAVLLVEILLYHGKKKYEQRNAVNCEFTGRYAAYE